MKFALVTFFEFDTTLGKVVWVLNRASQFSYLKKLILLDARDGTIIVTIQPLAPVDDIINSRTCAGKFLSFCSI